MITNLISRGQSTIEIILSQQKINEFKIAILGKWISDGKAASHAIISNDSNTFVPFDTLTDKKIPFKTTTNNIEFFNNGYFRVSSQKNPMKYSIYNKATLLKYNGGEIWTYYIYLDGYKYRFSIANEKMTLEMEYSDWGWIQPLKKFSTRKY